jgi:hypothetical protein
MDEFLKPGISQAELARRMGKGNDQICRWLGEPGNWTLDSVSDLLFAISGAELDCSEAQYPLDAPPRNLTQPDWFGPTAASMLQEIESTDDELCRCVEQATDVGGIPGSAANNRGRRNVGRPHARHRKAHTKYHPDDGYMVPEKTGRRTRPSRQRSADPQMHPRPQTW